MLDFFAKAKESLTSDRKYWADYLFHFTYMKNAVSILEENRLLSRNKASGIMQSENASISVITNTNDIVKDYVRFYFRPKTPTQYCNEGLKTGNPKNPHCPRPVFFLFSNNIVEKYSQKCILSEKTLASELSIPTIKRNILELNNFNYKKIYHLGGYDTSTDSDIKQYKQAEFCVKDEIDLSELKCIVTRSIAEKDSLLYYLHCKGLTKFDNIICCSSDKQFGNMFNKENLYIDLVVLTNEFISIKVINNSSCYHFKYLLGFDKDSMKQIRLDQNYTFVIPKDFKYTKYIFAIYVEGEQMYKGEHYFESDDFLLF